MAQLPLDQAITRFQSNENRLDTFANGGVADGYVSTAGIPVPSIQKFLAAKDTQINVGASSVLALATAQAEDAEDSAIAAAASAIAAAGSAAGAASAVASAVNGHKAELAATNGSALIGHTPAGTGAVPTTVGKSLDWNAVHIFRFLTEAQIADVRSNTATIDLSPAFAVAMACLHALGSGSLITPRGTYLLKGVAGGDSYKNGILIPHVPGDFSTRKGIRILGEGVDTVFKAGSANMIVLRHSRLYSGGENFRIDGAGLANVIGRGIVPESMTQTTTLVSQSFATYRNIHIENCTEGSIFQPGPTVLGADSGGFYHKLYDETYNNNSRDVWLKPDVTGSGNRTTRTAFYSPVFMRGNTGVHIDAGTEIDFHTPCFELKNTGTSPNASPTAIYLAGNPSVANIRIFGGYAEACTVPIYAPVSNRCYSFGFFFNNTAPTWKNVASFGDFGNDGTWVPSVASSGGGAAENVTLQNGYWSKNGRAVTISGTLRFDKGTLASGTASIGGIPFPVKAATNAYQQITVGAWGGVNLGANYTNLSGQVFPGSQTVALVKSGSAGVGSALLTVAELAATGNFFSFQATYLID